MLMARNYPDLDSASFWMKQFFYQSEALSRFGYSASSVWNFCARGFSESGKTTGAVALRNVGYFLKLQERSLRAFTIPQD